MPFNHYLQQIHPLSMICIECKCKIGSLIVGSWKDLVLDCEITSEDVIVQETPTQNTLKQKIS